MFEDQVPKRKIGYLSPLPVIDSSAYETYQLLPKDIMLVMIPVGLQDFTREDVERVYAPLDKQLEQFMEQEVDIVLQAGVPLPLLVGMEAHDRLLEHIAEKTGVPATSSLSNVMTAAKRLGIKNVAVANKWSDAMNESLARFFGREDISVAGTFTRSLRPSEFVKINSIDSVNLAYELGRGAMETYPEADGLYIGGGAWITLPVVEKLEKEFGKPVIVNHCANVWNILRLINCWKPISGYGRLLSV